MGRLFGLDRLLPRDDLLGVEIRLDVAGNARRGRGLSSPGATALNRTRENWLNDLANMARELSRAALIGAM